MPLTLQQKEASIEALGPDWFRFLLLFQKGRDLHMSAIDDGPSSGKLKDKLRAAEEARYHDLVDLLLTVATDAQGSDHSSRQVAAAG